MKQVAHENWSPMTGQKLEDLVEATSRISGIAAFLITIAGLAYLLTVI